MENSFVEQQLKHFDKIFTDSELGAYVKQFFSQNECPQPYLNCFDSIRLKIENGEYSNSQSWIDDVTTLINSILRDFSGSPISFASKQILFDLNEISANPQSEKKEETFLDYLEGLSASLHEYVDLLPDNCAEFQEFNKTDDSILPLVITPENALTLQEPSELYAKLLSYAINNLHEDKQIAEIGRIAHFVGENSGTKKVSSLRLTFANMAPATFTFLKKRLVELGAYNSELEKELNEKPVLKSAKQETPQPE